MKKSLLAVLAMMLAFTGISWAEGKTDLSGYMGPNFRMIDQGEDTKNDIGFGLAFNRVTFSGMQDVGPIVKKIGWKIEADFNKNTTYDLVYAYVQAYFSDAFSARFGHLKESFGREWLHPTYALLTVDRLIAPEMMRGGLDYMGYSYGLEFLFQQEMFKAMVAAYDGQRGQSFVGNQDPVLDYNLRAIVMPTAGLEIGANLQMKTLPGVFDGSDWACVPDDGVYPTDEDWYQTNSAMAYGVDLDYQKTFNEKMSLWAQAELGMGDNYGEPDFSDADEEDTWQDYSWYSFQYFYVKALLMVTKNFGIHAAFASIDPNTNAGDEEDDYAGKNDSITKIIPGITYRWSDKTRTQVEVQLVTHQEGMEYDGENWVEADDTSLTHFVLQQVLVW
jgi:hypothetical protein